MPRTVSNEQRFVGKKKEKATKKTRQASRKQRQANLKKSQARRKKQTPADGHKKADTPQMWLSVLYHWGLAMPWDWRHGPSDSSEREHVTEMAKNLPENAMLAMDAGFVGYDFWQSLNQAGVAFVSRVGSNVRLLKNLGYVRRREDLVYVWPDKARRALQPPLVLRLVPFRGGKEDVYVVTNVLEQSRLPDSQLQEIYTHRWGVEVYYRDFKQTFDRTKLRSKCAANAVLELDWSILGLWSMCLYTALEHQASGLLPRRRSISKILRSFRQTLETHRLPPLPQEDLCTLLRRSVQDNYHRRRRSKSSRSYPRQKEKHAMAPPEILEATPAQQLAAQSLAPAA